MAYSLNYNGIKYRCYSFEYGLFTYNGVNVVLSPFAHHICRGIDRGVDDVPFAVRLQELHVHGCLASPRLERQVVYSVHPVDEPEIV